MADASQLEKGTFRATTEVQRVTYASDTREGRSFVRENQERSGHRRSLSRASSMSIRATVDPSVALPPLFKTISYNIEDSKKRGLVHETPIPKAVKQAKKQSQKESQIEFGEITYHKTPIEELLLEYQTSRVAGLTDEEAAVKIKTIGRNIPSPPPSQWFRKSIGYLFGGFGSILFVAAILVFIAWKPLGEPDPAVANLALAIVLVIVWTVQAAFSFWQDFSSSRIMASITQLLPEECMVLRNGNQQRVDGRDVVPGDILRITMGNKLPADVRFLEASSDARFDRSILTGETAPLIATTDATDENYLETANVGLAGTHCVSGSAWGLILETGDRTVFGRIAKLTSTPKPGMTPLQKEIFFFVLLIVSLMLVMIIIVIAVWAGWLRHSHPGWISVAGLIVDCVSVAVAFIPEGLPIAVVASLSICANIMRKNKILCKSLKTVETLGAVNVICSDKTGTLTRNQMSVTDFLVGKDTMLASDVASHFASRDGVRQLADEAAVCNDAEFDVATMALPIPDRKVNGDATDSSILRFAESMKLVSSIRSAYTSIFKVAFNSKNKFAIHIAQEHAADEPTLMIKGAPDILLPRCTSYVGSDGSVQPMTESDARTFEGMKDFWSAQGKRVILLARQPLTAPEFDPVSQPREYEQDALARAAANLTLVGLVAIVDPPRAEIPEVVRILRGAGIRVFMVTGDFKLTAQAIAVECGIITQGAKHIDDINSLAFDDGELYPAGVDSDASSDESARVRSIVLSGADLETLNAPLWDKLARYDEIVFARTTPEHKLKIVRELQARELTVGMTGDGVNDAPSLKEADIGIAMGSGSDIAIEAADMVLLDSFAAIVEAVRYGRVVYDNLKKTICYLLPAGSFSEFWPVFTNVVFGLPQILSSFLMIIICCFTDCAAATAIAYEKPEADVLNRPPRNAKKDRLVDWKLMLQAYGFFGVIESVASFSMAYWYCQQQGLPFSVLWFGFGTLPAGMTMDTYTDITNTASSIYFVNLVVMQWFTLFAIRTRRLSVTKHAMNWYLLPAICFALVIAIFFLYVPRFHAVLGTATIPAQNWFYPMAFGLGLLLLDEARKFCVRRWPQGPLASVAW